MKKMFFVGFLMVSTVCVQAIDEFAQCNDSQETGDFLACKKLNGLYNALKKEFDVLKQDNCDLVQQKQDCVNLMDRAHIQLEKLSDEISYFCIDCEKTLGLDRDVAVDLSDEYIQVKSKLRNNRELLRTLFLVSLYRQFTKKYVDDIQRNDRKFKYFAFIGGVMLGCISTWLIAH